MFEKLILTLYNKCQIYFYLNEHFIDYNIQDQLTTSAQESQ